MATNIIRRRIREYYHNNQREISSDLVIPQHDVHHSSTHHLHLEWSGEERFHLSKSIWLLPMTRLAVVIMMMMMMITVLFPFWSHFLSFAVSGNYQSVNEHHHRHPLHHLPVNTHIENIRYTSYQNQNTSSLPLKRECNNCWRWHTSNYHHLIQHENHIMIRRWGEELPSTEHELWWLIYIIIR